MHFSNFTYVLNFVMSCPIVGRYLSRSVNFVRIDAEVAFVSRWLSRTIIFSSNVPEPKPFTVYWLSHINIFFLPSFESDAMRHRYSWAVSWAGLIAWSMYDSSKLRIVSMSISPCWSMRDLNSFGLWGRSGIESIPIPGSSYPNSLALSFRALRNEYKSSATQSKGSSSSFAVAVAYSFLPRLVP